MNSSKIDRQMNISIKRQITRNIDNLKARKIGSCKEGIASNLSVKLEEKAQFIARLQATA